MPPLLLCFICVLYVVQLVMQLVYGKTNCPQVLYPGSTDDMGRSRFYDDEEDEDVAATVGKFLYLYAGTQRGIFPLSKLFFFS